MGACGSGILILPSVLNYFINNKFVFSHEWKNRAKGIHSCVLQSSELEGK